jgi:DNA-binding MarR family transcriptional regulator
MTIESNLEKIERLTAKVWRVSKSHDPLAHLSFNEYDYLKSIQLSKKSIRLTDLALEMNVSKPSASNMVKRLERKELVEVVNCSDDARVKRVRLTAKAEQSLLSEIEIYKTIATKLCCKLNSNEKKQLDSLLTKAFRQ